MSTSEIATALAWTDALNARDIDTLIELSADGIEIGAADGAVQGLTALQEWAEEVVGSVEVGRMYVHDGMVVFEQSFDGVAEAAAFRVVDDKVAAVFRHEDLAAALAATDLTEDDLDA